MQATQINNRSEEIYFTQTTYNAEENSNVKSCALSSLTSMPVVEKMKNHIFPVANWVVGGEFTLTMKDGLLIATPFQIESQQVEYTGLVAASLSEAVDSIKSGAGDFCLVANENDLNYTHSIVFKHEGNVMTRPFNFTQIGLKNGGWASLNNFVDFHAHTVKYAAKHGVPVAV